MMHGNTKTFNEESAESNRSGPANRPVWRMVVLGFFTGIGGALIGVGGGIIMIPILTMWGFDQKRAQGTSLIVIAALVPVAIVTYAIEGNIDFAFAIPLALGGAIGSIAGSQLALRFSNRILAALFGGFLLIIAIRLIWGIASDLIFGTSGQPGVDHMVFESGFQYLESALLGALAGLAAGFFGVGGGVVFVPTGTLLAGLSQVVAQGSSLTAMLPTALIAVFNYAKQGEVDWRYARWMTLGAWVGTVIGSLGADFLGNIRNGYMLTAIFAGFLIFTGVKRMIDLNARSAGNS